MDLDLDAASALDLAAAIRAGEVSPTEALEATLAAIEQRNPALGAIVAVDEDDARARARAAEARLAEGGELPPFLDVPIPIKDLSTVAGWPCSFASAGAPDEPAAETDPVVQRLEDAGFVLTPTSRRSSPASSTWSTPAWPATTSTGRRCSRTTRRTAATPSPSTASAPSAPSATCSAGPARSTPGGGATSTCWSRRRCRSCRPGPARSGRRSPGAPEDTSPTVLATVACTSMSNMSGLPAISVPVGHDEATGLPVGVQLVAGPWRDDVALQVAAQLERQLPWAHRRPPGPA